MLAFYDQTALVSVSRQYSLAKTVLFNSVQKLVEIEAWLLLTYFISFFTQSIKFYVFHCHILEIQMFEQDVS